MPSFDIIKEVLPPQTFRAQAIIGNFDIDAQHIQEHFKGSIDIEGKEWAIGLIVGGSGTGKSTIAKQCFADDYITGFEYNSKCVLDDMPKNVSVKDIELMFTSVGFSSPPSWLKPYDVLSNGEKMRVDLARALLMERDTVVFDEFTSVVDRDVAKTTSCAIAKAVRRMGKRFVAVACHRDIIEWLCPDWVFDTDTMKFFGTRDGDNVPKSKLIFTELTTALKARYGTSLESITI